MTCFFFLMFSRGAGLHGSREFPEARRPALAGSGC